MNIPRRLLTATLIASSCLFAIQPVGAKNASAATSDDESCTSFSPRAENAVSLSVSLPAVSFQSFDQGNASDCGDAESSASLAVTGSGDEVCTNIGPMVFNLGLGSASSSTVMASVSACHGLEVASSGGTVESVEVQGPGIEGSIAAMDEPPAYIIYAEHAAAVSADMSDSEITIGPDQARGQPS